ncbi:XK-related protein 6-like [Tubulanus polymorphus]|uniref:XK-related protein 6-like n=1 Tax=Tubulanus polymorphus TaxID=672921 RepID=UPI003DA561E9
MTDIGSDVWLCLVYYRDGDINYFACSVAFIVFPSVTMTLFSLWWYITDYRQEMAHNGKSRAGALKWILRSIFLILQLAPVVRYMESLYYGVKSQSSRKANLKRYYYNLMLYEDADSTLLRLIESFMESAPQLVLQLYIMVSQEQNTDLPRVIFQAVSCSISLLSLAWSLTSYHKALRFTRDDKENLSYCGMLFHFLWQSFIIGPRVVAIAMFASHYGFYIFIFIGCHWVFMSMWLILQKTNFCNHKYEEYFFDIICGVIYIFCFFNVKEGQTRHKYSIYYSLIYLENVCLIVPWYLFMENRNAWYHTGALIFVLFGHFVGIVFMLIFYKWYHPSQAIRPFRPNHMFVGMSGPTANNTAVGMTDLTISLPDVLEFEGGLMASTPTKVSVRSSFESNSSQKQKSSVPSGTVGTPV